jgi:hypothetical protein
MVSSKVSTGQSFYPAQAAWTAARPSFAIYRYVESDLTGGSSQQLIWAIRNRALQIDTRDRSCGDL